jgi:putative inorganic carbon (HCO3(-)) transporter
MTIEGIATQGPGLAGVPWMSPARARENAIAFWSLMVFSFILFIAPQELFPVLQPLRLAQVSAVMAVLTYVLSRLVQRRPLTVATPEMRLVALLTLVAVVTIPFSLSPDGSFAFFLSTFLKSVVVFFLIANLLETVGRLKLLIVFIVVAGLVYAATGLYNFVVGHTIPSDPGRIWGYPAQFALNPDDLGLLLNVILWLAFGLWRLARRLVVRVLLAVGMTLMVGGIIVSFSRGAFLALVVTLAVLVAKLVRTRGPLVLVPIVAVVVLGVVLAPSGYAGRLYSIFDPSLDRVGSISERWNQIEVVVPFILENPVFGAGLGQETLVYEAQGWKRSATHNIFLLVATELGFAGLLIYVLLFVQILRGLRRTQWQLGPVPEAREVVAIAAGMELAVFGFLVGAFFLPFSYSFAFYYLAGIAAAIRVLGAQQASLP